MSLKRRTKLKIWGWVCILIGVIGFISIIMRGNPNLGPSVWVAIGVYLLYRKNTQENSLPLHKLSIQWYLLGFATIAINEITPG